MMAAFIQAPRLSSLLGLGGWLIWSQQLGRDFSTRLVDEDT